MPEVNNLLIYGTPRLEALSERARKFGFSSISPLEHLWWDYEFTAQLQKLDKSLILRGGAAAQLYVDPYLQRGSIDVDLVTSSPLDEIKPKVDSLIEKFASINVSIEEYHPRRPVEGLEQLTYHVHFPKLTGKGGTRRIKLEIQRTEFEYPSKVIVGRETLALRVSSVKCATVGALIGDKLTTLASKTIGVGLEDCPKQLYDLNNLAFNNVLSAQDTKDLMYAFSSIVKQECRIKQLENNPIRVIDDIETTLAEFAGIALHSEAPDQKIKQVIRAFESLYVGRTSLTDDSGWALKALKLKFLVRLIRDVLNSGQSNGRIAKLLKEAKSLEIAAKRSPSFASTVLMKKLKGREDVPEEQIELLFWKSIDPSDLNDVRGSTMNRS